MAKSSGQSVWTSSPCLATIRNELCGRACNGVLDLGQAQGSLMEFYSSFASKTHVVDLFSSLTEPRETDRFFEGHLPSAESGFDLVTAWDVPNYLPPERITELSSLLAERMNTGALLYFVIGCTPTIPRLPWRFALAEHDQLLWERSSPEFTDSPRYLTGELQDLLSGFKRIRSCLLSNGYQEYLLARQ